MYRKWIVYLAAVWYLIWISPVLAEEASISAYVKVKIPVLCSGEDSEEVYEFRLTCDGTGSVNVKQDRLCLKNGETGVFEVLCFDAGTYHCQIYEEDRTDGSRQSGRNVYCADIFVTEDEAEKMYAEMVIYIKGSSVKEEMCRFHHKGEQEQPVISDTKNEEYIFSEDTIQTTTVRTGDKSKDIEGWVLGMGLSGSLCIFILAEKRKMKGGP